MRKLWLIIKREYLTRIRSKGFLIGTFGIPLLAVGGFGLAAVIATRPANRTVKLAILDRVGGFTPAIIEGLDGKLPNGQPAFQVVRTVSESEPEEKAREEMRTQVRKGQLDGCLVVTKDLLEGKAAEFYTKNPGDFMLTNSVRRAVSNAVVARRLSDRGIHVDNVRDVIRGVDLILVRVSERGESIEKGQTFIIAMMLVMLMYTSILMYGMATLRSILEEKSTRTIEILAASVRPFYLLAGKILGVAAVGLTQFLIWAITGALLATYGTAMVAAVRPGGGSIEFHLPILTLVYMVLFFLAGYLLYASLFAAVGAMVSNEEDAQQMQWPVMMPAILGVLLWNVILRDPNSTASVVLSMIPLFTPILMLLRIALQTPPFWQIALSVVILLLTTAGVTYFSAKIYRVGILMYGKRPSLAELLRWLRYT
jgi:ABC-2 type transport system permease protein